MQQFGSHHDLDIDIHNYMGHSIMVIFYSFILFLKKLIGVDDNLI